MIEYIATQEAPKINTGHVLDNGNNTFRGLRLIDPATSTDLAYFEFTDLPGAISPLFSGSWSRSESRLLRLILCTNDGRLELQNARLF